MTKAMLIDTSKCTACKGCQIACKQWNDLQGVKTRNTGSYQNPPELSAKTWMIVIFKEFVDNGKVNWLFQPMHCMHCANAPCVSVCPTGAMHTVDSNYVVVNTDWCIGCGYCVESCPYGVAKLDPDVGVARKCHFCIDRVLNELPPACAKTCPPGAISFDDRDTLLSKASKRVEALRNRGYPKANLYGDKQLRGLNTLYVLLQPPSIYGLPEAPASPQEKLAVGWASGLIAAGLLITFPLWWVIKRREMAKSSQGGEKK